MIKIFILVSLLISNIYNYSYAIQSSTKPSIVKFNGTIEVAFSPNNFVTNLIVDTLRVAKSEILLEAYSFTSVDIFAALLNAKKRGVNIYVILDKSQSNNTHNKHKRKQYAVTEFLFNNDIAYHIDTKHAIFHNKVIIIDQKTVITGSFNFTKAAETKNAENLLVIKDSKELANIYIKEFWYHYHHSK